MKRLHRLFLLLLVLSLLLPSVLQLPVSASEISLVAEESIEYLTLEEAGELIRTCMAARENVPAFHVIIEESRNLSEEQIANLLLEEAFWHTGIPGQGDELSWVYSQVSYGTTDEFDGNVHKIQVSGFNFRYYNTPEQEKILCDRIDQLMIELDVANKSDYEKIETLYEYVCENVSYSDDFLLGKLPSDSEAYGHIHTSYGALINGSAVCQGYASLIYRLMLEAGIDCRLIAGDMHGWNIVKLDGSYYFLDATWDSDLTDYRWFLNGSASFQKYGHAPWPEYNSEAYLDAHPISPIDYGAPAVKTGSGQCGENAVWTLSGDGVLTISGTGTMWDAGTEDALWFGLNGYVKQVVIEEGITSIGNYVFYNSPQLTEVSIPSTVTHIGNSAFGLCNQLESIVLPDSIQTVGNSAFVSCARLREIKLSAGMKEIPDSMFINCPALENVTIPNGVTKIGKKAFANCTALKTVMISDSVTVIELQAFAGAFAEDYDSVLVIPESVTEVGADCFAWSNLREITWNAKAERVEKWTFYNMPYLKKVTFSDAVTHIDREAFQHSNNLEEVRLSKNLVFLGEGAFSCCSSLKFIELPESLTTLSLGAFLDCLSLESIVIPSGISVIEASTFQGCTGLKHVTISEGVREIKQAAFAWCHGLETVTFLGDAPAIYDSEEGTPVFQNTRFVAYYPKDNATWTDAVRKSYGAREVRWIVLDPNHTTHTGDNQWYWNYQGHWQNCVSCTELVNVGPHTFDNCMDTKCNSCDFYRYMEDAQYSEHQWLDADCDNPRRCKYCGKAEGAPLGHIWQSATCEKGEHCSWCGVTFSAPLGHNWIPADCDNPKTCATCNKTEGLANGHDWLEADCANSRRCSYCGKTEGAPLGHVWLDATCETSAVCNQCGLTSGSPMGHSWTPADCGNPKTCVVCNKTAGTALGHNYQNGTCIICGGMDPNYAPGGSPVVNDVSRVYGNTRYDTAFKAADMLKEQLGVEKFQTIIVANGESFADALSGSYLAAVKDAPILLVKNNKTTMNQVKDYIRANLAPGGTVYLLGGVNAIPQSMETGLETFHVKRLGGATRYATNLLILEEAGVKGKDILICTGTGFADSLSASAVKLPILLVNDSLNADQKAFLAKTTGKKYIIGGINAVSERIENAVKAYGETERLGGATRYATSILVAEEFFENPTAVVLAYAQNFPDGLSGGALACGIDAPLILTATGKDSTAAAYTKGQNIKFGYILGGPTLISDKAVKNIFAMTAGDSIVVK